MAAHIQPSFSGIVLNSRDALLLFTAAIQGRIPMITRRPHDKERAHSIASGNVFIYCEHGSSIKRWTDGVTWSPSRIMGNFLIYRELNKGFPPGEKKRAAKKKRNEDDEGGYDATDDELPTLNINKDQERSLIGSLIDSYDFKKEGLVKKTISVKVQEQVYHLVSYYTLRDVISGELQQPSTQPLYAQMQLIDELITGQNFRVAVDPTGADMGNSPNTPPPPGSGTPPIEVPGYRNSEYAQQHPYPTATGSFPPSPNFNERSFGAHQLQYEVAAAPRSSSSYSHYGRPHDDYVQSREVPRTTSFPGPGDFQTPYPASRSYSADSLLHHSPSGLGGTAMSQVRSGSASYTSGSHFGTTDPASYISGQPVAPLQGRFMEAHPMAALSAVEKSPGLNAYSPTTRPHQPDHGEDSQRTGMAFGMEGDFSTTSW